VAKYTHHSGIGRSFSATEVDEYPKQNIDRNDLNQVIQKCPELMWSEVMVSCCGNIPSITLKLGCEMKLKSDI
jgi:hypothetical protein